MAMKLLLKGDVPRVIINDLDRAVWCMWEAIVNHPDELIDFIWQIEITIGEWKQCREVYRNQTNASDMELAKASFFLNRTNVSGILEGGVIGGLEQTGKYKMDARFNRKTLTNKVRAISDRSDDIEIYNMDAENLIEGIVPELGDVFLYLDPPYVKKGPGLYRSAFDEAKHRSLAMKVKASDCKWVVTYDDDPLVDELYSDYVGSEMKIWYSAHSTSIGREKLILSPGLSVDEAKIPA